MKTKAHPNTDLPKVTINPNLKSSRNSPFVVRMVEEAKKHIATLDLSILNISKKS